jgi:hypothetical protein
MTSLARPMLEMVAGFGSPKDLARLRCLSRSTRDLRASWSCVEITCDLAFPARSLDLLAWCLALQLEHVSLRSFPRTGPRAVAILSSLVPGLKSLELVTGLDCLSDLSELRSLERLSLEVEMSWTEPRRALERFPVPAKLRALELTTDWQLKEETQVVVESFLSGCCLLERVGLMNVEYPLAQETLNACAAAVAVRAASTVLELSVPHNSKADWGLVLASILSGKTCLRLKFWRYDYGDDCVDDQAVCAFMYILSTLGLAASWVDEIEHIIVLFQAGQAPCFEYLEPRQWLGKFPEVLAQHKILECVLNRSEHLDAWLGMPLGTLKVQSCGRLEPLEIGGEVRVGELVLMGFAARFAPSLTLTGKLKVLLPGSTLTCRRGRLEREFYQGSVVDVVYF